MYIKRFFNSIMEKYNLSSFDSHIKIYSFDSLSTYSEIIHFVSTRFGGESEGEFSALNLSLTIGDEAKKVEANRQKLFEEMGISLDKTMFMQLIHGDTVREVQNSDLHKNDYHQNIFAETDALITNEKGICLFVLTADCVPLVMYEPDSHAIAVIHAGWKGTVKKLAQKTALKMRDLYGSDLANIRVGIAPAAGSCCYEIGAEVENQFLANFPNEKGIILERNGKKYLDLAQANLAQLTEIGLLKENIELSNICTICEHETFFSYRKEGGKTGRFGTGIMIKNI